MNRQTIDTYKLTSAEEPSDEVLSQLMHEAAMTAKRKGEEAHRRFFSQLRQEATRRLREWNGQASAKPVTL